jgi:HD superfamily phosphohydrolase
MLSRNAELIRLRSIGMMNFRSVGMLPLTTITRLEHSVGITYLVELFSRKNRMVAGRLDDFLTAALYHDINCASFGHAVEWAIDRHHPYEHESTSSWISEQELDRPEDKPMFFSQDGLHHNNYEGRYHIDLKAVKSIISGQHTCVIKSSGIDLDNIDNVSRMAFYLGLLHEKSFPIRLAESLTLSDNQSYFVVDEDGLALVGEWLRIRSAVYREFIYSREYMGFEYLVFLLVHQYAEHFGTENVRNLFHYTDERLLWTHTDRQSYGKAVSNTAQRLLLNRLPECYIIFRAEPFSRYKEVSSSKFCDSFIHKVASKAAAAGVTRDECRSLAVHVTTDNKKTSRSISLALRSATRESQTSIGEDRQYILLAILGSSALSPAKVDALTRIGIEILLRDGLHAELAPFANEPETMQKALF